MPTTPLDPAIFPQTHAVETWLAAERAKGLVDVKFFVRPSEECTLESLSKEVLEMEAAEDIADDELF